MRLTISTTFSGSLLCLFVQLSLTNAWTTYTVPHDPTGADDTPALAAALATGTYSTNATILFQQGVKYNIFTPIKFPVLQNVEVRVEGNISYPTDVLGVQALVQTSTFPGAWFTFSGGTNVTLRGSTDPNWGWIDGYGQLWWDTEIQVNRPHGIAFSKITNGVIRDMKIWQPIAWVFSSSGSKNLHVFNNKIVARSTNVTTKFPFNTDGFSAGGVNQLFENNWVENGDDCLTVGNGAKNVTFRNTYCKGGHGLSIGSLGSGGSVADVQDILIENIFIEDSLYGARFKSWTGGNGAAKNIRWKNIAFSKVRFPIYVTQNYWDQNLGPKPNSTTVNNTHIENMTFENFAGSVDDAPGFYEGSCVSDPCWYYLPNTTGREVIIFDLYPTTASNIVAKDIFPTTKYKTGPPAVLCDPATVSNDVGFKCMNGPFIRTAAGV